MKGKLVLLGVAVLALGLMVMPFTMSAYVGRTHDWSQDGIDNGGALNWTQTECDKCHGSMTGEETTVGAAAYHADKSCSYCHNPTLSTPGVTHTAVTIPDCTAAAPCHNSVIAEFNANEPHYEMYNNATTDNDVSKTGSANEACIACHTNVTVTVNFVWTESPGTITIDATGGAAGWITVDYS